MGKVCARLKFAVAAARYTDHHPLQVVSREIVGRLPRPPKRISVKKLGKMSDNVNLFREVTMLSTQERYVDSYS